MSLTKKMVIAALSATVALGSVGAAFADDRRGGGRGMPSFEDVDTNGDGKLDFAEFSAPMTERFDEIDADGNGIVTEAEIDEASDDRRAKRMVKRIAKRFDIDSNDEVTKAEMENRQAKMFALLDMNDDGFISENEAPKRGDRRGGKKGGKRGDRG